MTTREKIQETIGGVVFLLGMNAALFGAVAVYAMVT